MRYLMVALCLLLQAGGSSAYASENWNLKKDRDGIQIYTRKVEGSPFKAVRGITRVNARLSSLVALVRDAKACPDWADRCGESWVHEKINDTEEYVYTLNELPWPVADRDVLAHVRWSQSTDNLAVTMLSSATEGLLEKKKGIVRLTEANAQWIFTPLESGEVEVVTLAHINPAGPLPAWVTNLLLVDAPFNTLSKLREAVQDQKYLNAGFSFISEPE